MESSQKSIVYEDWDQSPRHAGDKTAARRSLTTYTKKSKLQMSDTSLTIKIESIRKQYD